ncbi:MAG: response regulator, partial [Candidatus Hydrogenedentes bacterium]|nr:response regulator [Candidatus Hydrogenedentota bacterium]
MTESSHSIPLSELKTKKIFVIDDDLTQLTLISSILKKFGLEVTSFQNPADALKKISTGAIPDIIFTDIFMPRINGLELCRILKSDLFPQTKETPILIISSQIIGEVTKKIAKESGAYDFIELPTSPDVLLEKISSALLRDKTQEERLKILIIHSKDHPEPPWYRITDDPKYIPFVTTSIEQAIPLLEKEHFHIVLVSSQTEGDTNKLFLLLNQHPYKKQTFTILIVPPQSPQPFLSWVEQGLSGILTKPVSIENVLTLYEKLKTEQMLIRTKHILEEKIKQKLEEEIRWVTILHSMPVGIFIKDKS